MGKRSRQRGGPQRSADEDAGGGARRPAAAQRGGDAPASVVDRVKTTWKVAGEHAPDKDVWSTTSQVGERGGPKAASRARRDAAAQRAGARGKRPTRLDRRGERPPSPFGRWPVTEVATIVGLVLLGIGIAQGTGSSLLKVGVILVALAAIESTVREHLFGYRSHALFLGILVTLVTHLVVALILGGDVGVSNAMLGVDVVLFLGVAWWLHQLYQRRNAERPGALRRSTPKAAGGR